MAGIRIKRGYVSATVAADLLGVSRQRVNQLLNLGRFKGAFLVDIGDGREMWCIPRTVIESRIAALASDKNPTRRKK